MRICVLYLKKNGYNERFTMLKIKIFSLIIALLFSMISSVFAGVSFIVKEDEDTNTSSEVDTSGDYQKECRAKGFGTPVTSCTGNTLPGLLCPLNSQYTDKCCSAKYAYVITSSCLNGTVPSSDCC